MAKQAALNARNIAAAALAEELRQLKKYKENLNPKKRLLEQKLKRVEEAREEGWTLSAKSVFKTSAMWGRSLCDAGCMFNRECVREGCRDTDW